MRTRIRPTLSTAELDALGTSTDIVTAGRGFGLSRDQAYDLAREGRFPCTVLKVGSRYVVPVAGLRRALGVDEAARAS